MIFSFMLFPELVKAMDTSQLTTKGNVIKGTTYVSADNWSYDNAIFVERTDMQFGCVEGWIGDPYFSRKLVINQKKTNISCDATMGGYKNGCLCKNGSSKLFFFAKITIFLILF